MKHEPLQGNTDSPKGYFRKSPEERVSISDRIGKSLEPVIKDLEELGVSKQQYSVLKNLGMITATLTLQQAEELREKSYEVIEDFKLDAIQ